MLQYYLSLILDDAAKSKFEEIYLQHRQAMLWAARQILQDDALSEDAVHDAFIKILNYLEKISLENCHITRSFVVIIVKNTALDYLKHQKRHATASLDDLEDIIGDPDLNPEEALIEKESQEKIRKALKRVRQSYKEIMALHANFNLNAVEIAHLLNMTPENVRAQLHRGRAQLAKYLKENE